MKILEIACDAPPYKGGISRCVQMLTDGLKSRGHTVDVLSPKTRFRAYKFSTIPFHKYDNYDIIHIHGPTPFLSDLTLLINDFSKIVYTHHAEITWLSQYLSKGYRRLHKGLAVKTQAIVVTSHDYSRLFKEANVSVIPLPCPLKFSSYGNVRQKASAFTVLYVGQFRPFKGMHLLIKSASILKNVRFVFVGDGYLKPQLTRRAQGMENLHFYGAVDDRILARLYEQSHVICLPSVNTCEAYGMVLVEGALHACVPLASNLLGVRETISRLHGISFTPKSYRDLVSKIASLADDSHLYRQTALKSQSAAQEFVETYSVEHYVNRHEEIMLASCN